MSIACKLLEHIVCMHIWSHTDMYCILGEAKHGFSLSILQRRSFYSQHTTCWKTETKGNRLMLQFLISPKHSIPFLTADSRIFCINGDLLWWIEAFLVNRLQSVIVDGVQLKEEAVISNVPQGTVLGSLIFLLYILLHARTGGHVHAETRCRLFADDTLLYRVVETIADLVQLQQDLKT